MLLHNFKKKSNKKPNLQHKSHHQTSASGKPGRLDGGEPPSLGFFGGACDTNTLSIEFLGVERRLGFTLQGNDPQIPPEEVRKIIDSKVPTGRGYVVWLKSFRVYSLEV